MQFGSGFRPNEAGDRLIKAGKPDDFKKAANDFLREKYGETDEKTQCIDAMLDGMFYLNRAWMKSKKLEPIKVDEALAA